MKNLDALRAKKTFIRNIADWPDCTVSDNYLAFHKLWVLKNDIDF